MLVQANLIIKIVLSSILTLVYGAISTNPLINDTVVVGSLVRETKVEAPSVADSIGAAASKSDARHNDDVGHGDVGFKKSRNIDDHDGYSSFKSFHNKDGDGFGYAEHYEFGKKDSGKNGGGYRESQDFDDEDEADNSLSPKYSQWHFEEGDKTPYNAKSYHYRSDGSGDFIKGKLVEPEYEENSSSFFNDDETSTVNNNNKNKRSKRKKEPRPSAATEYDNYEYADVEEPDEGEAEEGGDPEYGAIYADADAYDYY